MTCVWLAGEPRCSVSQQRRRSLPQDRSKRWTASLIGIEDEDSDLRKPLVFSVSRTSQKILSPWHRGCEGDGLTSTNVVDGPAREVLARRGRAWLPPQSRVIGRSARSWSARSLTFIVRKQRQCFGLTLILVCLPWKGISRLLKVRTYRRLNSLARFQGFDQSGVKWFGASCAYRGMDLSERKRGEVHSTHVRSSENGRARHELWLAGEVCEGWKRGLAPLCGSNLSKKGLGAPISLLTPMPLINMNCVLGDLCLVTGFDRRLSSDSAPCPSRPAVAHRVLFGGLHL